MINSFVYRNVGKRFLWALSFLVLISCSKTRGDLQPQRIVILCPDFYQLEIGKSFIAVAKAYSESGPLEATVEWSSSDYSVAEVSKYGIVEGKAIGKAQITASLGEVSSSINVEVVPALVSFNVNKTMVDMRLEDEFRIELVPSPPGAAITSFICISSDEKVVKVIDDKGLIKAVGYGNATVKVIVNEMEKEVAVKVTGDTPNEGFADGGNGVWE